MTANVFYGIFLSNAAGNCVNGEYRESFSQGGTPLGKVDGMVVTQQPNGCRPPPYFTLSLAAPYPSLRALYRMKFTVGATSAVDIAYICCC